MFKDKEIFITGGTGSWGQELVKQLMGKCKSITVMARNEANIVAMSRKYPDVKCIVGDVRDFEVLNNHLKNIDVLFHLAAVKHVPICEEQPEEAINTNIMGALNIIKTSKLNNITDVILISTDKAVEPINTYGISKAMAEKLFLNAGFKVIRAGNVIGSSGSVIPLFKNQIEKGEKATLTSMEMTRFFMTLKQAINLVIKAYSICAPSEVVVVGMPSFSLIQLLKVLAGGDWPIELIGIRPGEKLHELLISEGELPDTYYIEAHNLYIVTKNPGEDWPKLKYKLSSEDIEQDDKILSKLLEESGYL